MIINLVIEEFLLKDPKSQMTFVPTAVLTMTLLECAIITTIAMINSYIIAK